MSVAIKRNVKVLKQAGLKQYNDPNAFIECSNDMHDIYKNIDD